MLPYSVKSQDHGCLGMASITFGSVGDVISICQIVIRTVTALSKSHGSAFEYRNLIDELYSLSQGLEAVKSLLEQDSAQTHHSGRLRAVLDACQRCLERELESIRRFESSLGWGASSKRRWSGKNVFRKLQWQSRKVWIAYLVFGFLTVSGSVSKGVGLYRTSYLHSDRQSPPTDLLSQ